MFNTLTKIYDLVFHYIIVDAIAAPLIGFGIMSILINAVNKRLVACGKKPILIFILRVYIRIVVFIDRLFKVKNTLIIGLAISSVFTIANVIDKISLGYFNSQINIFIILLGLIVVTLSFCLAIFMIKLSLKGIAAWNASNLTILTGSDDYFRVVEDIHGEILDRPYSEDERIEIENSVDQRIRNRNVSEAEREYEIAAERLRRYKSSGNKADAARARRDMDVALARMLKNK